MPPRLLLLNTDLEPGGTPTVVRELARRLSADGVEGRVACLAPAGPVAREIEVDGIAVDAFGMTHPWQLPTAVRRLRQLVADQRITHVLSFLMHANVVAAMAARRLPDVHWFQSIQTTQPKPAWHWPLQRWAAKRAERVVVPSTGVAEVARQHAGVVAEKLVVVPNAIDASTFAAEPRQTVNDPLRVGFLGRLDPVKNVDILIDAVERLPDAELSIFGDGPERPRLEKIAANLAVTQRVQFHGLTDRNDALAQSDVLVLPSSAEGFGLVLIEAMAAGVPVVGSDIPGIRDVITHDETGLLVPPGDAGALAAALSRLREDANLRHCLARAALAAVRERFTWDNTLVRWRAALGI